MPGVMFMVAVRTLSVGSGLPGGFCVEQLRAPQASAIVIARVGRKDLRIGTS